eukprot:3786619-Rhodomonas_salina.1
MNGTSCTRGSNWKYSDTAEASGRALSATRERNHVWTEQMHGGLLRRERARESERGTARERERDKRLARRFRAQGWTVDHGRSTEAETEPGRNRQTETEAEAEAEAEAETATAIERARDSDPAHGRELILALSLPLCLPLCLSASELCLAPASLAADAISVPDIAYRARIRIPFLSTAVITCEWRGPVTCGHVAWHTREGSLLALARLRLHYEIVVVILLLLPVTSRMLLGHVAHATRSRRVCC